MANELPSQARATACNMRQAAGSNSCCCRCCCNLTWQQALLGPELGIKVKFAAHRQKGAGIAPWGGLKGQRLWHRQMKYCRKTETNDVLPPVTAAAAAVTTAAAATPAAATAATVAGCLATSLQRSVHATQTGIQAALQADYVKNVTHTSRHTRTRAHTHLLLSSAFVSF